MRVIGNREGLADMPGRWRKPKEYPVVGQGLPAVIDARRRNRKRAWSTTPSTSYSREKWYILDDSWITNWLAYAAGQLGLVDADSRLLNLNWNSYPQSYHQGC